MGGGAFTCPFTRFCLDLPPLDDPLPAELQSRAEQLRTAVNQLVDLLDLNHPSTVKLKVMLCLISTIFELHVCKFFHQMIVGIGTVEPLYNGHHRDQGVWPL